MALGSIMNLFVPKNKVFFTLFENLTATNLEMSEVFVQCVAEKDLDKRTEFIKKIEDLEHANDETTHQIFLELGKNFITPLDREDIHALASSVDDVSDYICGAARILNTYNIQDLDASCLKLADCIHRASKDLKIAVVELRNLKNVKSISEACIRINSIENEADYAFEMAMSNLFENEKDVVRILKMKDLYENMERSTDKCEDAANVIESIIVKYA
jgi:predicted phosphate transport protein (TIGR00153 family)